MIYLIGSLRNPEIPKIGNYIRSKGYTVFDSWYAVGPEADDYWRDYEKAKGLTFKEALKDFAAQNTFHFDKDHIDLAQAGILVLPAGKSGHLELGYMLGQHKPGYILIPEEPERFDVMYNFATGVFYQVDDILKDLERYFANGNN